MKIWVLNGTHMGCIRIPHGNKVLDGTQIGSIVSYAM